MTDVDFSDPNIAMALRDAVADIVAAEVEKLRPKYRWVPVVEINGDYTATVLMDGPDSEPVPVRMGTFWPTQPGQLVRVEGVEGDRFITDVWGGAAIGTGLRAGDIVPTFLRNDRIVYPWAICGGQTIINAELFYPDAWENVTDSLKSGSNLLMPDIRGRVLVGADDMGGSDAGRLDISNVLGTATGEQRHTMTEAELRQHTHNQNSHNHTQDAHNHGPGDNFDTNAGDGGGPSLVFFVNEPDTNQGFLHPATPPGTSTLGAMANATANQTATNQPATAANQNTGSSTPFNVMQPSIVCRYKMFLGRFTPDGTWT